MTFTFLPIRQVTAGAGREAVAPRSSASFQTRDRRKRSETTSYEVDGEDGEGKGTPGGNPGGFSARYRFG